MNEIKTVAHGALTITVSTVDDIFGHKPWEIVDGHGPVREILQRGSSTMKRPGERVLGSTMPTYLYDFAEACRIARRDGWDTEPYNRDGKLTKKQQAARAVEADFKRLSDWVNERWCYVVVVAVATDEDGCEVARQSVAGVESDYVDETADELVDEIIHMIAEKASVAA